MASRTLAVAVRPPASCSVERPEGLARDAARQRPANDRDLPGAPGAGAGLKPPSICVIGEHRIDVAAPAGTEVFEQFFRRSAAGAGYREKRVDKMGLVLACRVAPRPTMQAFPRDLQHFECDVAECMGAQRRREPEPRHIATHRLALFRGPICD